MLALLFGKNIKNAVGSLTTKNFLHTINFVKLNIKFQKKMMKRLIVGLLTAVAIANGEVLYTDGSHDIDTCLIKGQVGSIDFPCYITDIYYPDSIQADIKKTAPKSVAVVLTDETGTLTAVCRNHSYTLVFRASDKCDNHKVVVDKRIVNKEYIKGAAFDKEALLNPAGANQG